MSSSAFQFDTDYTVMRTYHDRIFLVSGNGVKNVVERISL